MWQSLRWESIKASLWGEGVSTMPLIHNQVRNSYVEDLSQQIREFAITSGFNEMEFDKRFLGG